MERENRKRGRSSSENDEEEKKAKKQQQQIDFNGNELLKSTGNSSFDVFDFPWLKEKNLVSESEEWKKLGDDDVFSSCLLDSSWTVGIDLMLSSSSSSTNQEQQQQQQQLCTLSDSPSSSSLVGEDESWALDGNEIDGGDCIWSSVLNQPLSKSFGFGCVSGGGTY
ncbi:hypothetical protein GIB67_005147 [Kingdonia uniflora]|uniref:Uncharacterized protein n=1 Tax=Kingdonia uniflora TaxID=39325 RepID=A0A7J7MGZ4_9MAGN|nr:hypothetical protein GIB67_008496 [Kingdonia uniflora]KAF6153998.1 hypothetical protein GIB67_005147 [Kingdonia uniflora]